MKQLLLTCFLATVFTPIFVHGGIGHLTCTAEGVSMDAAMENTMMVKCPLDIGEFDIDFSKVRTEAELEAILMSLMGPQFKCIFGLLKAIDSNTGKLIPAKAEDFAKSFPPKGAAKVKPIIAKCIKAHNGELRKEAGKHAKSWEHMSKCLFETMIMPVC